MKMKTSITVARVKESKIKNYDFQNINFGSNTTDHMFISEYKNNEWRNPRIIPYQDVPFSPISLGLHYGQSIFEGFKAYKLIDGNISVFRPKKHFQRMNKSLKRMCMPLVSEDLFMSAIESLIQLEQNWVPNQNDASLYIRPLIIATEARLGVKISDEYLFMIVCMPMASYYNKNLKVKVETEFIRAADGGTGNAKCAGNYGAAFYPTQIANKQGFDQILWTDSEHHEFIEESGTMNVMFVIENKLITPAISNTILDGVTRDSIIKIAKDLGIKVEERKISYIELIDGFNSNVEIEAFGVGTAAVISPIECIDIKGKLFYPKISNDATYSILALKLSDIRTGKAEDLNHWNYIIKTSNDLN